MRRPAAVAALLGLWACAGWAGIDESLDSGRWTREYDPLFQKYAKRYFGPHFDWRWFKAQGVTESNLRPQARSRAGAVGLMQILPSTFAEIRKANPHYVDIESPRWNIAAGIYYDRRLYAHRRFDPLPDEEQLLVAFACYNAGLGGILRVMKRTPPPVESWQQLAPGAPRETRGYVDRIVRIRTGSQRHLPPRMRGLAGQLGALREPPER